MSQNIEIDKKELERMNKLFKKTPDNLFNKGVLNLIAMKQKNRMHLRTLSGEDYQNKSFSPYNASYALKTKKTSVNDVNLTLTSNMLDSMTTKADDMQAVIFFGNDDAEFLADIHQNRGAGRSKVIRKFFGMSEDDKDKIMGDYTDETAKRLGKLGYE